MTYELEERERGGCAQRGAPVLASSSSWPRPSLVLLRLPYHHAPPKRTASPGHPNRRMGGPGRSAYQPALGECILHTSRRAY
eukprot:scaffold61460_cov34-Tisochrysis_lutea.AAC.3